jgi:hypothetical protein
MREIHIIVIHHTEIRRFWIFLKNTPNTAITLSANVRLLSKTYIFYRKTRVCLSKFTNFNIYAFAK